MLRTLTIRRSKSGFTLVELLVVTLILSILMAVALPLYLSSVADAKKKTCRANMQTIANAVQAQRVKDTATDYSRYEVTLLKTTLSDLPTLPVCPNGGTYSVAAGTTNPAGYEVVCSTGAESAGGDGKFEPGVDSK